MRDHVLSLPNKLQEEVAEGGDNFSAGQRQVRDLYGGGCVYVMATCVVCVIVCMFMFCCICGGGGSGWWWV